MNRRTFFLMIHKFDLRIYSFHYTKNTQQHSATLSNTQQHSATLSNTQQHSATLSDGCYLPGNNGTGSTGPPERGHPLWVRDARQHGVEREHTPRHPRKGNP